MGREINIVPKNKSVNIPSVEQIPVLNKEDAISGTLRRLTNAMPFFPSEEATLEELSFDINQADKIEKYTYVVQGTRLFEINRRQLYKETHQTFENYVEDTFGFSRQKAYNLIQIIDIYINQFKNVPPARHFPNYTLLQETLPIAKRKPELVEELFGKASEFSKAEFRKYLEKYKEPASKKNDVLNTKNNFKIKDEGVFFDKDLLIDDKKLKNYLLHNQNNPNALKELIEKINNFLNNNS